MHLIHIKEIDPTKFTCDVNQLELQYFISDAIPEYAILSHTWTDDEVSFQDLQSASASIERKLGYAKIRLTCRQALRDGLIYVWVDTCE